MRKLIMLVITIAVVGLVGCGAPTTNEGETPLQTANGKTEKTVFEQFEDGLTKQGFDFKKTTMGAELIGAEQGEKYTTGEWSVELYQFDKSSDAFKEVQKSKAVKIDGFGNIDVKINNNMVLMDENASPEHVEQIYNLFNSLQ